jgi:glutathionylspermidine synthase
MRTLAWPLEGEEFASALSALRFGHCKWDLYQRGKRSILPDAIVLSAAEHDTLVSVSEGLWRSLRAIEEAACADPEALDLLGVPPELFGALARQRAGHPRVSRCDFHRTVDGSFAISEFNEDVPSGFIESVGIQTVLAAEWAERFAGLRFAGDLRAALVAALSPHPRVGMIFPTAYSEDLQHVAAVAGWLEAAGHATVLGSPANLVMEGEVATLFGEPVDALFRCFPGEWIAALPNVADWERACAAVPMMNPLSALVAQSKRFYALAADPRWPVADETRALLATYLGASLHLEAVPRETLLAERERWVLKGAFGRMGDSVCIGSELEPAQWERALDAAFVEPGRFAVQERFDTAPMWFSDGIGYATIGAFLVDGRFCGYFSRVAKTPLIGYEAGHVATLVEVP